MATGALAGLSDALELVALAGGLVVEDLAPDAGFLLVADLLPGLVDPFFAGVFAAVVSRETSGHKLLKSFTSVAYFILGLPIQFGASQSKAVGHKHRIIAVTMLTPRWPYNLPRHDAFEDFIMPIRPSQNQGASKLSDLGC